MQNKQTNKQTKTNKRTKEQYSYPSHHCKVTKKERRLTPQIIANPLLKWPFQPLTINYFNPDTADSPIKDTSVRPRVGPCLSLLPLFDSL